MEEILQKIGETVDQKGTNAKAMIFCLLATTQAIGCSFRGYNEPKGQELTLPADASTLALATPSGNPTDGERQSSGNAGAKDSATGDQSIAVSDAKTSDLFSERNIVIVDSDAMVPDSDAESDDTENEVTFQEDSEKSFEELNQLIPDASIKIEGNFPLCEGSIYLNEWNRSFESRWRTENSGKIRKRSKEEKALKEARSQAFLRLLYPALGLLEYDFPAVITEDVLKWMQYFQTRGRDVFVTWLRRAEDVTPAMLKVLEAKGLPQDLVYLSMIESGFNNRAMSFASASGPWQFMRATGRMFGLRVDDFVDERRDPERSTFAAAAYLSTLYTMFGDWHLAAASYNSGEGRVMRARRAMPGTDQDDFFSLSAAKRLPNETRNYVPKIIAAMIIAKNPLRFGFDVADGSRALKSKKISVDRPILLADLASATGVDLKVLESLNPELRLGITPPPTAARPLYALRIPESQYNKIESVIAGLPPASLYRRVTTRAPRKELTSSLARRFGISLVEFLKANPGLKASTKLKRGQVVSVPIKLGTGQFEKFSADREPTAKRKKKHHRRVKARRASR